MPEFDEIQVGTKVISFLPSQREEEAKPLCAVKNLLFLFWNVTSRNNPKLVVPGGQKENSSALMNTISRACTPQVLLTLSERNSTQQPQHQNTEILVFEPIYLSSTTC